MESLLRSHVRFLQKLIHESDKYWNGNRSASVEKNYRAALRLVARTKSVVSDDRRPASNNHTKGD
jgi:hypothetical protein